MERRDVLGALASTPLVAACGRDATPPSAEDAPLAADAIKAVKPLGFPWETPDPFLFCVHHDDAYPAGNERFGPAASLAGRQMGSDFDPRQRWRMYHGQVVPGFPQHPHRGFETVTVVRRGLIDHADSMGAAARYGDGDVQWLTAGKGIVHAEMFPLLDRAGPNPLELFQIWLNLPAIDKMAEPHFRMLWASSVPTHVARDRDGLEARVTVVAGRFSAGGIEQVPPEPPPRSWASRADGDVAIWVVRMAPGARFTLPRARAGSNRRLYFFSGGELWLGSRRVPPRHHVELRSDVEVPMRAGADEVELLMLQGRPIGEPVAQRGPFVMNTPAEIQQAFVDYRQTGFGGWPWPTDDPVHGPARERFARHADGRVERAT